MNVRTRGISVAGLILAAAMTLAGCSTATAGSGGPSSSASSVTVTSLQQTQRDPDDYTAGYDVKEVDVEVPVNPQRVVVLDSTMLEAIDALGVPAQQIAGTRKWHLDRIAPDYAVDSVADIQAADGRGYDLEVIESLHPDLIITGWRGSASAVPGIEDIDAPQIELTPGAGHTVASLKSSTLALGRIFDRQDAAATLVDGLDAAITHARAATKHAGTGVVVMTTGGAMSGISAGESRYGILYNDFGVTVNPTLEKVIVDLAKQSGGGQHGFELSAEAILAANPDWIYVIDRDAAIGQGDKPAQQILDNELINTSTAGSKGQIVYLDPVAMYAGEGIVSYTAAGEQIAGQVGAGH